MKFTTKFISIVMVLAVSLIIGGSCSAAGSNSTNAKLQITKETFDSYWPNNIGFYNADACEESGGAGSCGNTAKEVYWSALSGTFSKEVAAGIMGNIANEGAFNPVAVESCTNLNPFDFATKTWTNGWTWERYFNNDCSESGSHTACGGQGKPTGVGAFGITSGRSDYLHHVDETAHNLIEYFQHPELYSYGGCNTGLNLNGAENGGDALRKEIGDNNFNQLVKLEVEWLNKTLEGFNKSFFDLDKFKEMDSPEEAARYFAQYYERCDKCDTAAEQNKRASEAKKIYDEMKDFTCMASANGEVEGTGVERVKSATKVYGQIAMQYQLTYGVPWEVLIAQMQEETQVGTTGSATYCDNNWLGLNGKGDAGSCNRYAKYTSVEKSIEAWAGPDFLRNGAYDDSFQYLDVLNNKWDLHKYLYAMLEVYAPWDDGNDVDAYVREVEDIIKNMITPAREEMGWPSSEEFARQNKIPVGGKYPLGTPKDEMRNGLAPLSSGSTSSGGSSATSNSKVKPAKITLIGDSISVMSQKQLQEAFPDSFFTMVGSRSPTGAGVCSGDEGGKAILEKLVKGSGTIVTQDSNSSCRTISVNANSLNDTIVWALGTNTNGADENTLNEILNLIGNKRKLYLVTIYNGYKTYKQQYDEISEVYRTFAKQHDNVYIIEWNSAVAQDEGKYLIDESNSSTPMIVHPTDEGKELFVKLISEATGSTETCATSTADFTFWSQSDEQLNAQDSSLKGCGCGPTSFAMLATALTGTEITPVDVATKAREKKIWPCSAPGNFAEVMAPEYGLEYQKIEASSREEAAQKVTELLKQGWMIQTSGNNCSTKDTPLRSGSCYGHVIGIRGITSDGKWLVANSGINGKEQTLNGAYDPQEYFVNDPDWQIDIRLDAIRASGTTTGNANNCLDACGDSGGSSGLISGGMNLEQAKKFVAEYKAENVDDLENKGWIPHVPSCEGGSMSNCVSYVMYFLYKYTTKGLPLPNAKYVVQTMIQAGYKDGGKIPKSYAIFSTTLGQTDCGGEKCGHTGVVLGIDEANNKIIIGEAGCSKPFDWTDAHEYDLSTYTNGAYTYAYTDEFLIGSSVH